MFNKTHTTQDRLEIWRQLRQRSDLTLEHLLERFSQIPVQSRYIDFYTPDSWPSVFDIVAQGFFCQSGITLVLASTMHYAGFITSEQVAFPVISNSINSNTGLVLRIDHQVYNLIPGSVANVSDLKNHTQYTEHIIPVSKLYN
jgi:hypothetical protein